MSGATSVSEVSPRATQGFTKMPQEKRIGPGKRGGAAATVLLRRDGGLLSFSETNITAVGPIIPQENKIYRNIIIKITKQRSLKCPPPTD